MPIARFQMPDGRIARFEVAEGTTPEQAQQVFDEFVASQKPEMTWGQTAVEAVKSLPRSTYNVAKGVAEAVMSPLETARGVVDIAAGGLQNILPESLVQAVNRIDPNAASAEEARRKASAVGEFYKQRYGSEDGIKQAIATDPASVLADVATLATGGGAAAAKVPGLTKAGQAVAKAGQSIDPLSLAARGVAKGAPYVGGKVADVIGGIATQTGGESLRQAARAGAEGGERASGFLANLRGNVPMESVLDDVKGAVREMRAQRSDAYRSGMAGVNKDPAILKFDPIDKALGDVVSVGSFKGKVINRSTAEVQQKIADLVNEWRNANPADFHTVEGMDALKRAIGDIRDSTQFGTPSRVVADRVYNAVKGQINMQAPGYAKVMKDYEDASRLVKEIERSLSVGEKASADTAMRKLQSLTRNNVNTNYGNRRQLASELEKYGAPNLMSDLSGQALSAFTPRGLGNVVAGGTAIGGLYSSNPLAIPALAIQSPRLMGEAAYYAGKTARGASIVSKEVNDLAKRLGVTPSVAANILYQAQENTQRGLLSQ